VAGTCLIGSGNSDATAVNGRSDHEGGIMIESGELVFIGPGSEWFWVMLQFVTLSVTFYAIYRQLRLQQVQMTENTKVLRAEAHHNSVLLAQRPWEFLLQDEGLARVVTVAYESPEVLTSVEWERQQLHVHAVQRLGVRLLPGQGRLHPEAAPGRHRGVPQGHHRDEARLCTLLAGIRRHLR